MTSSRDEVVTVLLLGGLALPTLAVAALIVKGFVLSKIWEWFILPVFESAPAITVWQAVGINIVVSVLTDRYVFHKVAEDGRKSGVLHPVLAMFTSPALVLTLSYLIKTLFL